jgi:ABC-type dipeptide/oligopeptide/nickel transport system ATPase component
MPTAAGWVRPVNGVSLLIGAGECVGLVGESGSGKTMLSLALMGLLPAGARVSGELLLSGSEEGGAMNPVMRLGAQIEEAILAHGSKIAGHLLHRRTRELLAAVPEIPRSGEV